MSVIAMLRQLNSLAFRCGSAITAQKDVTFLTDGTRSFVFALKLVFASPKSSSRPLRGSTL